MDDTQIKGLQINLHYCLSQQASNSQGAQTLHCPLHLTSEPLHLSPALLLTLPVPLPSTGPCSPARAPAGSFAEHTQLLPRTAQSFLLSPPTAPHKPKAHHQTGSLPPSGPARGTDIQYPQKTSCEQPKHMDPLSLLSIYVTDGMCKVVGIWIPRSSQLCLLLGNRDRCNTAYCT